MAKKKAKAKKKKAVPAAYDEVYDKFIWPNLAKLKLFLARWFPGRKEIAEEVLQETQMTIIKLLPKFMGKAEARNFVLRVAANKAKETAIKKMSKETRKLPLESLFEEIKGKEKTPLEIVSNLLPEQSKRIMRVFKNADLSKTETKAMCFHYGVYDDRQKTVDETAAFLGIKKNTAQTILAHARKKIRKIPRKVLDELFEL